MRSGPMISARGAVVSSRTSWHFGSERLADVAVPRWSDELGLSGIAASGTRAHTRCTPSAAGSVTLHANDVCFLPGSAGAQPGSSE